jgi:hypothetical protein
MPGVIRDLRGKGTAAVLSRYQATASEEVTVDTSVCVCVFMRYVSKSAINPIINLTPSVVTLLHVTMCTPMD